MTPQNNTEGLPDAALLGALADMLQRGECKGLPLPYVWWHPFRNDWWLSTDCGSNAFPTFKDAVTALVTVAPNARSADTARK